MNTAEGLILPDPQPDENTGYELSDPPSEEELAAEAERVERLEAAGLPMSATVAFVVFQKTDGSWGCTSAYKEAASIETFREANLGDFMNGGATASRDAETQFVIVNTGAYVMQQMQVTAQRAMEQQQANKIAAATGFNKAGQRPIR